MTDFNKKGGKFAFTAKAGDPRHFSLLSPEAHALIEQLYGRVGQRPLGPEDERVNSAGLGCLERLSACLLQTQRLADHASQIRKRAPDVPGSMVGVRAPEALFDFEALLFHSRSALDRLTCFICRCFYGDQCDIFSRIRNVLGNFRKRDTRVGLLETVLAEAFPILENTLIDVPDGKRCLRSELIHRSTAGENCYSGFVLHCPDPNRHLAFDTILADRALLSTTATITSTILFVILNALSIYFGLTNRITLIQSQLSWQHGFVDFRDFEASTERGKVFSVWKAVASGFVLSPVVLREDITEMAY